MPQLFRARANGIARLLVWGAPVLVLAVLAVSVMLPRSDFATGSGRALAQPVPFSHQHHVDGLGLDCRYCHDAVETSAFAGLPATEVCMTCHSQLWTEAEALAPVRASLASGEPLRWQRVNSLPDFTYFNHAIHVDKGVGCVTCHGPVEAMPLTWQVKPLTMGWCLECHRDPAPNLRPPDAVFRTDWTPPDDIHAVRAALMQELDIDPETMTDCYVCHR